MTLNSSNQTKRNSYRYRIKYDSFQDDCYPYWVEYNGGWRTLWLWFHLSGSASQTLELAICEIEHHKKRVAKALNGVETVYSE